MLETLEPLAGDRKCFRLINGVLVERTVEDVVPALKTNQEGLKKVLDDLVKQYKTKQDDLDKWKVRGDCCNRLCEGEVTDRATEKEQCAGSAAIKDDDQQSTMMILRKLDPPHPGTMILRAHEISGHGSSSLTLDLTCIV